MEKEINAQTDVKGENPKEIILSGCKYIHTSDDDWDYLVGSDKGFKITLKFSKDKEKNRKAMEGIQTFISWL